MIPLITSLGEFGYLLLRTLASLRYLLRDKRRFIYHLDEMGVKSILLVLVIGFFSGAIIAWQAAYQVRGLIPLDVMGNQTSKVIVMEMGPVLTALVISGRLGASITAEIGAMKLTEQLDALRVMAIDPVRFLVMPRVTALAVMLPILTFFADMTGILGAYAVSNYFLDLSAQTYFLSLKSTFLLSDIAGGLFKAFIFGLIISLIGCYMGLISGIGTTGVGRSTIRSFVLCSVCILIGDFFLWLVIF